MFLCVLIWSLGKSVIHTMYDIIIQFILGFRGLTKTTTLLILQSSGQVLKTSREKMESVHVYIEW